MTTVPPFTLPLTSTLGVSELAPIIFTVYPFALSTVHVAVAGGLGLTVPARLNVLVPNTIELFSIVAARHCDAGSAPALAVTFGITVNVLLHELVQLPVPVTVTEYVPAAVKLLITAVFAVKPPGPAQEYELPPEAVKLPVFPAHMVRLLGRILQFGGSILVSVRLQELVQPPVPVTVTEYVPAAVRLLMIAELAVKPPGPDHE
jgi:hypothetical protein